MKTTHTTYSRGQLAKLSQVNSETIRYYEKTQLLEEPIRADNGYRIYTKAHLTRLNFIRRSRELGFSINEIKALINLQHAGEASCEQVKTASQMHLNDIQNKITDLMKIQASLQGLIEQCESNSSSTCPVLDSLFA